MVVLEHMRQLKEKAEIVIIQLFAVCFSETNLKSHLLQSLLLSLLRWDHRS